MKLNQEVYLLFFSYFQGYTCPKTHNNVHDLTDDNYSVSTFAVQFRAVADSSLLPPFSRISGTLCPPTFVCSSYISAQTFKRLLARPAVSHPAYQDKTVFLPGLDFQLLLVNPSSILKINRVMGRPLKANYNSTICYSHILWLFACEAKYVCRWII